MSLTVSRRSVFRSAAMVGALTLAAATIAPALGADPVLPPPSSVGTDVAPLYQGPPPSQVQDDPRGRALVGPVQLLRSGTVDRKDLTTTVPLYRGAAKDGTIVWYILTDTTDEANAEALGLNHSAKLAYANVGRAVRKAWIQEDGSLLFGKGAVDFSPRRSLTPGAAPDFFPPQSFQPGSVGDADYSPLIRIQNAGGHIYNAPVIAYGPEARNIRFCDGGVDYDILHDRVVKICPKGSGSGDSFDADGGTVTLQMTPIFSFAKPSAYISTEASDPMVATLDSGTFAPSIGEVPVGGDDGAFSSVERLFPIANGPTGADNPQRQGLNSALSDVDEEGKPLPPVHVIGGLPTVALDYSPLWDLNLGEWTDEAIEKGYRSRLIDEFQLLEFVEQGWLTGPEGAPFGSTGIVVNCPIVMRFL